MNTSTYKEIKKAVSEIDLFYKSVKQDNFFLVSSFDKNFNVGCEKSALKVFISFLNDTFKIKNVNFIFTYNEFERYSKVMNLNIKNVKIIVENDGERNKVKNLISEAKRKEFVVLNNDLYRQVDRICNLDLRADILKLYSRGDSINVCFFDENVINKTFYFFNSVLVLRNLKDSYDGEMGKFPVDKYSKFHQNKKTFDIDEANQIELYNRG